MDLIRAIVLGAVQGLTEFLPVSSSGHLILVREALGWPDDGLAFDVGLHLGTLVALLGYFWRDWLAMVRSGLAGLRAHGMRIARYDASGRLPWLIALGTIPAAVAGLLLDDWIEENVRQVWLVATLLIVFGLVLLAADRRGAMSRPMSSVGVLDAVLIGLAQAIALLPGVSRSGVTISAGLVRGLRREEAARFAFLLGTPAFVGAGLLKATDLGGESARELAVLSLGFAVSLAVGLAAIRWLLAFLGRSSLSSFVVYRVVVGLVALVVAVAT